MSASRAGSFGAAREARRTLTTQRMTMPRLMTDLKEMVREQIDYRELLFQLVRRDLLIRYKQSVMGVGWAVFMPLVNTAVFSVIFTRIAQIDVGMPYPLFAYCGLLMWNLSASAWRFSVTSMTANVNLVTKVYFPREVFPLSAVIVAAVDSLVGAIVLIGLMIYYQVAPTPALAFLPVVVAVQLLLTAGIALLLSMANLFYRDVKYLFEIVITIAMFTTAVLYPITSLGGAYGRLLRLNPMSWIIDAYRDVLVRGQWPPLEPFAAAAVASVLIFVLSWTWFHRSEFAFAENI
jgi:ABC-type polysaccharide/polyol phosphate export permease